MKPSHDTCLARFLTRFFTRHLAAELDASPHTILSYRDTFRLFLSHVADVTTRQVSQLGLHDLHPEAILGFLESLEVRRGNSVATRNARLAAIRSFFSYVACQEPAAAELAQKVLAIPFKKAPGRILGYLTEEELRAILDGPDRSKAGGRRDYLVLALLYDTGTRVQELLDLCPADFRLDRLPLVRVTGKGRQQRIVPLLPTTAKLVGNYLREYDRSPEDSEPLLRNYRGEKLSRSGVRFLIDKYRRRAAGKVPTLRRDGISYYAQLRIRAVGLVIPIVHGLLEYGNGNGNGYRYG